jgi:hypothetical protein
VLREDLLLRTAFALEEAIGFDARPRLLEDLAA